MNRFVLHIIASINDPLGILSPVTIMFKLFFQSLCTNKHPWDKHPWDKHPWDKHPWNNQIDENSKGEWISMLHSVSSAHVEISRHYFGIPKPDVNLIKLHGFCDASKRTYSAIIYVTGSLRGLLKTRPDILHFRRLAFAYTEVIY